MSWPPLCMSRVSNCLVGPKPAVIVSVAVTVMVPATVSVLQVIASVTVAMTHACGAGDLDVCECIS